MNLEEVRESAEDHIPIGSGTVIELVDYIEQVKQAYQAVLDHNPIEKLCYYCTHDQFLCNTKSNLEHKLGEIIENGIP